MQIKPGTAPSRPLATNNRALAVTLYLHGVKWFRNERGQAVGVLNDYTDGKLREIDEARAKRGQSPLGLATKPRAEAIRLARKMGIPGNVTYQFEDSPAARLIQEGFDAQSNLAEGEAGPLILDPRASGAVCAQTFKTCKLFDGDHAAGIIPFWLQVPAFEIEDGFQVTEHKVRGGTERTVQGSYERTEVAR